EHKASMGGEAIASGCQIQGGLELAATEPGGPNPVRSRANVILRPIPQLEGYLSLEIATEGYSAARVFQLEPGYPIASTAQCRIRTVGPVGRRRLDRYRLALLGRHKD